MNYLNKYVDEYHRRAKEAGWHDKQRSVMLDAMLIASECFEIFEAERNGTLQKPCDKDINLTSLEEEIADIAIRLFDFSGRMGIDLDRAVRIKGDYNLTRGIRHGGKKF